MNEIISVSHSIQEVESHFEKIKMAVGGMMPLRLDDVDGAWKPSRGWRRGVGVVSLNAELALGWARQGFQVAFPVNEGIIVVDVDNKNGANGWKTLQRLKSEHGFKLLAGPHTRTKSDGRHLLYRLPEGKRLGNIVGVAPGIDLKSDGGLIRDYPSPGYQPLPSSSSLLMIDAQMLEIFEGLVEAKRGHLRRVINSSIFGEMHAPWTASAATETDLISACAVLDMESWDVWSFVVESIYRDAEALARAGVDAGDLAVRVSRMAPGYEDIDRTEVEITAQRGSYDGARVAAVFRMAQSMGWQNPACSRVSAPQVRAMGSGGVIAPHEVYTQAAPWSDAGLAMIALGLPGVANLRVVAGGLLTRFDGQVYAPDKRALDGVAARVASVVIERLSEAKTRLALFAGDTESEAAKAATAAVKSWSKALDRIHSTTAQKAFTEMLLGAIKVAQAADVIRKGDYLPTDAGLFEINTDALHEYNSTEIVTRFCPAFRLGGSGIQFQSLVARLWPDEGERQYAQRVFGMVLIRGTQRVILLVGKPRSGKGVLVECLESSLGELACAGSRKLVVSGEEPHAAAVLNIRGRRLVTLAEVNQARLAADRVKSISGGDMLEARYLYETETLQFRFDGVLLLTSNEAPSLGDATGGLGSRLALVPCRGDTLPEDARIRNLGASIAQEERGAVMAWLIEGARQFIRCGLQAPATINEEVSEMMLADDPIAQFLAAKMVKTPEASIAAGDLYADYVGWCAVNGESRPLSGSYLGRRLKAMGYTNRHTMQGARWDGLGRQVAPGVVGITVLPIRRA